MPKEGWITCNTDGASKGNPGQGAYGFCIRNSADDLPYAEAKNIGEATNMKAEVRAVWEALSYCIRQNLTYVQLKTDSLVLKNMLVRNWIIPWNIVEKMEEIHQMIIQISGQIQHIFGESNQLTYYVANKTINKEEK